MLRNSPIPTNTFAAFFAVSCFFRTFAAAMKREVTDIRPHLMEKLKQEHCLWSYDNNSIQDIPDDVLVELVMLYLDINDIDLLFRLFDYKTVKRAWIDNVVAQGERYYTLNYFFAWYYFHAKQPRRYVKAMATRRLNKRLSA